MLRGKFYVQGWERRMLENATNTEEGWSCWRKDFQHILLISFVTNIWMITYYYLIVKVIYF